METMTTESKHTPEESAKALTHREILRLVADVNLKMAVQDDAAYGANVHSIIYQWLEDNKEESAPETAAERDRLKEINKELVEALESIMGIEAWIGDSKMKALFQNKVYSAIEKSKGQ